MTKTLIARSIATGCAQLLILNLKTAKCYRFYQQRSLNLQLKPPTSFPIETDRCSHHCHLHQKDRLCMPRIKANLISRIRSDRQSAHHATSQRKNRESSRRKTEEYPWMLPRWFQVSNHRVLRRQLKLCRLQWRVRVDKRAKYRVKVPRISWEASLSKCIRRELRDYPCKSITWNKVQAQAETRIST